MTTLVAAEFREPPQRQALFGVLQIQAARSLAKVCELVDAHDVCVENLEDELFDMVVPLIRQYGTSICLDVGHLAWDSTDEMEFLVRHAEHVREVHLHDSCSPSGDGRTLFRDHLPLGDGELEYKRFLRQLDAVGFSGAVILEVNSRTDLETSLAGIRTSGFSL